MFLVLVLVMGIVIGFIIAQKIIKKQMAENPPINANQIRTLYREMGRPVSEAQVQQIMRKIKSQA
jgi:uncharacterized protein YneF (UPF0154 family)